MTFTVKLNGEVIFSGSKYLCHRWASEQTLETLREIEFTDSNGRQVKDVQVTTYTDPEGQVKSFRANPLLKRAESLRKSMEFRLNVTGPAVSLEGTPEERYKAMVAKKAKEPKVDKSMEWSDDDFKEFEKVGKKPTKKEIKEVLKDVKPTKKNREKPLPPQESLDYDVMSKEELQKVLESKGIKYHHKAGPTKLIELLNKNLG